MREFWTLFASAALVFVGVYYGRKFIKVRNYLLGYEWYILALSSTSGAVFAFGHVQAAGTLWHYLDLFSKFLGIPLIAGLGLLKVTHGYEPSKLVDVAVFLGSIVVTVVLFNHPEWAEPTLWAIWAASAVYTVILLMLTYQCFKHGLKREGWLLVIVIAVNLYVAGFEDFLALAPGDHMPVHLFGFVTAYLTWSVSFGLTYLFYVSLARAKGLPLPEPDRRDALARGSA